MLFQPSNITPSTLAGFNSQTVLTTDYIKVSWQINGNSGMTGYTIAFKSVSADGTISDTAIYTATKTLTSPQYATSENGEPNIYTHSQNITWGSRLSAGTYALSITQNWVENGTTKSIEQYSPNLFYVRNKPVVTASIVESNDYCRQLEFNALFSQTETDSVEWMQWKLYSGYVSSIDEFFPTSLEYDSGIIYSQNTKFISPYYYTPDVIYGLICTLCTSVGVIVTSDFATFTKNISYQNENQDGLVVKGCKDYVSVEFNRGYPIPENTSILGVPSSNAEYYIDRHYTDSTDFLHRVLFLEKGDIIWNFSYNTKPYTINIRYSVDHLPWGKEDDYIHNFISFGSLLIATRKYIKYEIDGSGNIKKFYIVDIKISDYSTGGNTKIIQVIKKEYPVSLDFINLGIAVNETTNGPDNATIYIKVADFYFEASTYTATITANIEKVQIFAPIAINYIQIYADNAEELWESLSWLPPLDWVTMKPMVFYARFIYGAGLELEAGNIWRYPDGFTTTDGVLTKLWDAKAYLYRTINNAEKMLLPPNYLPIPYVKINDYSVPSNTEASYFASQYTGVDSDNSTLTEHGIIGESGNVSLMMANYLLIEAEQQGNSDIYLVKKTWRFGNNIAAGAISNNNSPQLQSNFTGYRFKQPTSQIGKKGTLQALLSNVKDCDYNDTVEEMEALFNASLSNNQFFLKDMKGNIYKVNISAPITQTINTKTAKQQVTISLAWEESGSAKDAVIIEIE